jgi:hypothetical protein
VSSNVGRATGHDAVIVIPGIMGSELVETETGRTLWGLADTGWYAQAWMSGKSLATLAVDDAERSGDSGRITARRLLRFPAFAPLMRGFEPYNALTTRVKQVVPHRAAVLEFPYDWRLSVEHNAKVLKAAAEQHLDRWRAHPDGHPDARLVLVAHSMGGLVARYFTEVLGWEAAVRAIVTLGTPFYGSAKAAELLSSGRGAPLPLPRRRLRALARTLPGVYDLLPSYRCVDEGTSVRRLTPSDVTTLGGDRELTAEAFGRRERLLGGSSAPAATGLRPLVGVEQDTVQSLILADGVAEGRSYTCQPAQEGGMARVDRRGDGTVYREAACLPGAEPMHLPQTHGALAARAEGIAHACAIITENEMGPWLADVTEIGLRVPDVVSVAEPFEIWVSGCDDPAAVDCRVNEAGTGGAVAQVLMAQQADGLVASAKLARPGLYRIEAKAGGLSAVTELVLAVDPQEARR